LIGARAFSHTCTVLVSVWRVAAPLFVAAMVTFGVVRALEPRVVRDTAFGERVRALSEAAGTFDTDNLISNEVSYLEVMPDLVERAVRGGGYVGVGPDQNFSYIARIRPSIAYIIDIRRDNLLLHLLFKAMFAQAETRLDYLCLLVGRAPPRPAPRWHVMPLEEILAEVDRAAPVDRARLRRRLESRIAAYGVALTKADLDTIARFHAAFMDAGLGIRFQSHGRVPQWYYPTLRHLFLATDRDGRRWSYMADERAYRFVRDLQRADKVVPVVGDLSGAHAMAAIGRALDAEGERLSAIYVSNVENYLFRGDRFEPYVDNLRQMPRAPNAVIIRSVFRGGPSASMLHRIDTLLDGIAEGRVRSYYDMLTDRRR
jgi:hypothetical protein